jgi:hypothetical protein
VTKEQFLEALCQVDASKKSRQQFADQIFKHPENLTQLLAIAFSVDQNEHIRAAWVLEIVCDKALNLLIPHLDVFTKKIRQLTEHSAKRPMAKICEMVARDYYSNPLSAFCNTLTHTHKKAITEVCFDWLINEEKTAVKAFAMNTLFLIGMEFTWIHTELQFVLEKHYSNESPGYKARARHIIKKLKA